MSADTIPVEISECDISRGLKGGDEISPTAPNADRPRSSQPDADEYAPQEKSTTLVMKEHADASMAATVGRRQGLEEAKEEGEKEVDSRKQDETDSVGEEPGQLGDAARESSKEGGHLSDLFAGEVLSESDDDNYVPEPYVSKYANSSSVVTVEPDVPQKTIEEEAAVGTTTEGFGDFFGETAGTAAELLNSEHQRN